ncbi:hypothetical protein BC831DRAFT_547245 [Entophlyctis helioformis]|nr:hypothetical protein BC831DRAFT_547245 [Entophlyctis helioformis]
MSHGHDHGHARPLHTRRSPSPTSTLASSSVHQLRQARSSSAAIASMSAFRSLWILSLAYCDPLPSNLASLSSFACLGFVDLSYTRISWKTLQQSLRSVQILRLHTFGCHNLSDDTQPSAPSTASALLPPSSLHRGFLIFVLPRVWVLDGIFVTWIERQKWTRHFTDDAKGLFSALARKWKLVDCRVFVPSRLKTGITTFGKHHVAEPWEDAYVADRPESQDSASDGGASDADSPNESADEELAHSEMECRRSRHRKEQRTIWTSQARQWIRDIPVSFTMAVDLDLWRLRRLGATFEEYIKSTFEPQAAGQCLSGAITSFLAPPSSERHLEASPSSRVLLALQVFGSLFRAVPLQLLQATTMSLFGPASAHAGSQGSPRTGGSRQTELHWTSPQVSVLTWPIKDRLALLGMLVPRIAMDNASPATVGRHESLLAPSLVSAMARLVSMACCATYPHPYAGPAVPAKQPPLSLAAWLQSRSGHATTRRHAESSLFSCGSSIMSDMDNLDRTGLAGYDYDAAVSHDGLTSDVRFRSMLSPEDECHTAVLLLNVVQLTTLCPHDHLFVAMFGHVFGVLEWCAGLVASAMGDPASGGEGDGDGDGDGDGAEQDDAAEGGGRDGYWHAQEMRAAIAGLRGGGGPSGADAMSMQARAAEMRVRLSLAVEAVLGHAVAGGSAARGTRRADTPS